MNAQTTPWFDKYTRPHRVGVYSTRIDECDDSKGFNHWNGFFWEKTTPTPERQSWSIGVAELFQHIEWKGFTKEQK